jgi:hypothetical protein
MLMQSEHPNVTFGGGAAESTMSPIGLAAMGITIVLMFVLPRKWLIVPLLLFFFLVPVGEQFNVGGLHFFATRIVLLCGCIRMLNKSSSAKTLAGGFTDIDKIFLAWAFCRVTAFVLLYRVGAAVVNQVGFLWDTLGGYFLLRYLIRDIQDIRRAAKVMAVIAVIMAGCMLYEHYKVQNVFGLLMGGPIMPDIRFGHVRSRGVFEQEIIASVFGGTLVPLFIWLWSARTKVLSLLGLVSSVIITITASSSTGISAAAIGVGTLCLWWFRKYTRWMLFGLVGAICVLALVMKAPVWFALAHIDFAGGSTGWDRANLIDQCIRHFDSWWLVGTADNASWGFFTWDLCNQFAAEAVQGGLATLILFIALLWFSFRRIGLARAHSTDRSQQWLLWVIGCILCAHIAGFFGISYFDQIKEWWLLTLAMTPAALSVKQSVDSRPKLTAKIESAPEWMLEPTVEDTRGLQF